MGLDGNYDMSSAIVMNGHHSGLDLVEHNGNSSLSIGFALLCDCLFLPVLFRVRQELWRVLRWTALLKT